MALTHTPPSNTEQTCPSFNLPSIFQDRNYTNNDFAGSSFLVMFICNHCPYVKAIEKRLIELALDLKKQSIPVVAICSNDSLNYPDDSIENLQKHAREMNFPFVYLHDSTQKVAKDFGAVCTPDFFVYNKKHQLCYRGRLDDSWKDETKVTKRELFEATLAINQDKKVPFEEVPSMGCSIKWLKD